MESFREWLVVREIFSADAIEKAVVSHGEWVPSLSPGSTELHTYYYNLPSDPNRCRTPVAGIDACYNIAVSNGYLTFSNLQTGTADKHRDFQQLRQQNPTTNPSGEQMNTILKAISEYMSVVKPDRLTWSGTKKSTPTAGEGKSNNPNARNKVYFLWATRHLFPQYVPLSVVHWVRRDVYERDYVQGKGFPPVPTQGGVGAARQFIQSVQSHGEAPQPSPVPRSTPTPQPAVTAPAPPVETTPRRDGLLSKLFRRQTRQTSAGSIFD